MARDSLNNRVDHLGIIPDGGRRWAQANGTSLFHSYKTSMEKLGDYLHAFYEHGIQSVSIYMLSKDNLKRNRDEIQAVEKAESFFIETVIPPMAKQWEVSVSIAGKVELLPKLLEKAARMIERNVEAPRKLFLCLNYDPYDELCEASKRRGNWNNREELLGALWVPEEVNLVIRTGGAVTLSRFMPLQCGYARLIFLNTLFNDTAIEEFLRIIKDHEQMNLVFGT